MKKLIQYLLLLASVCSIHASEKPNILFIAIEEAGVRETFFWPLIEKVEARIMDQQGDKWDRSLFENDLMGYAMRTNRYRFVIWKDYTKPDADPLFVELYDHQNDPHETKNIAAKRPEVVANLTAQFDKGWQGSLPGR